MNKALSDRMASHAVARQIEASIKADAAAVELDRVLGAHWRSFVDQVSKSQSAYSAEAATHRYLTSARHVARRTIADVLGKVGTWGYRTTRGTLKAVLPAAYLRVAAFGDVQTTKPASLLEAGPAEGVVEIRAPGSIKFGKKKKDLIDYIAPPDDPKLIKEVVYQKVHGVGWEERLAGATRTSATPRQISEIVRKALEKGETHSQIQKRLLPIVDGVRSTAKRLVRTESLRVTHGVQIKTWEEGMGELIIGYQIHAVLDHTTRPTHRHRNGTIYYREPKAGQLGFDKMPHPPIEPDGTIAWNCRCGVSPILRPLKHLEGKPDLQQQIAAKSNDLIGDMTTYDRWFENADERRRRLAVGTARYSTAKAMYSGKAPPYAIFVDPDSGSLLTTADLLSETKAQRLARMKKVMALLRFRSDLLLKVFALLPV